MDIIDIRDERHQRFIAEDYIDFDNGYPERPIDWFKQNILPDFISSKTEKKNILDVGCASGYYTRVLAEHCDYILGVDLADNRIDHAKQFEADNIKFMQIDLCKKQLDECTNVLFDTVYTSAVFPHIPLEFKSYVFENISNVCAEGAKMVMYDGLIPDGIRNEFVGMFSVDWLQYNAHGWDYIDHTAVITPDGNPLNITYRIELVKR